MFRCSCGMHKFWIQKWYLYNISSYGFSENWTPDHLQKVLTSSPLWHKLVTCFSWHEKSSSRFCRIMKTAVMIYGLLFSVFYFHLPCHTTGGSVCRLQSASPANVLLMSVVGPSRHVLALSWALCGKGGYQNVNNVNNTEIFYIILFLNIKILM